MQQEERPPESLLQLIFVIAKSYILGIPSIIKNMIVSVILSVIVSNAVHFYLIGWVNDGWNPTGNPTLDALIFSTNHPNSPKVMLFYFMASYLFWWLIGMIRSRGIARTVTLIVTTPIWIAKSMAGAGFGAVPMILGGLAVSFLVSISALTGPSAVTMFLGMITVLVSQEESLMVIGLQLGFKDVKGLLNRGQQAPIPSPAQPVTAILGACLGFGYMTFFDTSATIILAFSVVTIAALVYMFIRDRNNNTAAMMTVLLLVLAAAQLSPLAQADDGGIKENGGWASAQPGGWLFDALVRSGYPASIAAAIGAAMISGLFSPPVLDKVKPLEPGDYVDKVYRDPVDDGIVNHWRWVKVDSDGHITDADGQQWQKQWTGKGLPEAVVNAEDSDLLGDRVRIFTFEPPKDQGLKDKINDEVMDIGGTHIDRLHPDNWKGLTKAQKKETMERVSDALKEAMGLDYEFEVTHDNRKGLGGSFRRAYTETHADGTTTEHKGLLKINSNGRIYDDPRTALRTIIHEARHAYQKKIGDPNGTDYQRITDYNNNNIQSSRRDYVRYGESLNERDSRSFGHDAANQLIQQMNERWGH